MKKISIPFEGDHYPEELLEFVRTLNEQTPVTLNVTFVPEVDYAALWSASGGMGSSVYIPNVLDQDLIVAHNSARVRDYCSENSIPLVVHKDRLDFALPLIRKDTRFSDFLLASSHHFFDVIESHQPNTYMKEILHTVESPVLLMPDKPYFPNNIILLYDGSASSMTAIKAFIQIFPEWFDREVTLVYLSAKHDEEIPDRTYLQELLAVHFDHVQLVSMRLDKEELFTNWLPSRVDPWVVAGAFGRSDFSLFMHRSFISRLIRDHQVPIFITH